jgi:serine protease
MRLSLRPLSYILAGSVLAACAGNGSVPTTSPQSGGPANSTVRVPVRASNAWNLYVDGKGVHALFPRGSRVSHTKSTGSHQLVYHGGPVQNTPVIYVDYWGFDGTTATDPDGVQPYLNSFLSGLSGNSYFDIVTQYYSAAAGNITDPKGEFAGAKTAAWVDTANPVPSSPTSNQIAAEAVRAAAHFGYNYNASYVVALPHGAFKKLSYCAYHSVTSSPSGDVHYTDLPYQPDLPGCGTDSVNTGAQGQLDSTSETAAHEVAETQTDPDTRTGWYDSSGNEIGDYCAYINLQNITLSTGTFAIQPLWSNAASYCAVSYP